MDFVEETDEYWVRQFKIDIPRLEKKVALTKQRIADAKARYDLMKVGYYTKELTHWTDRLDERVTFVKENS
jgi:hypothetical protein|tara:strand:- start:3498 stop:3710 length:213 start_codon:yes stop_codon:yes gene_type:complete